MENMAVLIDTNILLNYITGVLPDLDVYGVRQMTMEQLFVRLLYEDWDEKKFTIKKNSQSGNGWGKRTSAGGGRRDRTGKESKRTAWKNYLGGKKK